MMGCNITSTSRLLLLLLLPLLPALADAALPAPYHTSAEILSAFQELGAACQCVAGSTTAECAETKFCWADNTCHDAAKPPTACTTSAPPLIPNAAAPYACCGVARTPSRAAP